MFLLFHFCQLHIHLLYFYLHSNMFLLFLISTIRGLGTIIFTFQYVSIISHCVTCMCMIYVIYIPICFYYFEKFKQLRIRETIFTFQYVSIISHHRKGEADAWAYLHSNMFLLFLLRRSTTLPSSRIYIPICFYYFLGQGGGLFAIA